MFFCSVTVILLHCGSFCHENKFLVCVNIPGNKAHSDSDSDWLNEFVTFQLFATHWTSATHWISAIHRFKVSIIKLQIYDTSVNLFVQTLIHDLE